MSVKSPLDPGSKFPRFARIEVRVIVVRPGGERLGRLESRLVRRGIDHEAVIEAMRFGQVAHDDIRRAGSGRNRREGAEGDHHGEKHSSFHRSLSLQSMGVRCLPRPVRWRGSRGDHRLPHAMDVIGTEQSVALIHDRGNQVQEGTLRNKSEILGVFSRVRGGCSATDAGGRRPFKSACPDPGLRIG